MEKVCVDSLEKIKIISENEKSSVYELSDGSVLKIFSNLSLLFYSITGINLERKISHFDGCKIVKGIIEPKKKVYSSDGRFIGFTSDKALGINYNKMDKYITMRQRCDLKFYADIYFKLENIVKRANEKGIVFPDLCSCDNIMMDPYGDINIVDYDGFQVANYPAISISSSLGDEAQYFEHKSKYIKGNLFTPEIDKKSLIILYFLDALNIDLNKVGTLNPKTNEIITLQDVFNIIGLDDCDIMHKVWKLFHDNQTNEFLGYDLYRMVEKYNLSAVSVGNGLYLKRLHKKR